MATTLAIIVLVLMINGVATATVYALPIIQQVNGAQAQNGDTTQTRDQLQLQDKTRDITQTQNRLRLRDCSQNCDCPYERSGSSNQGISETTAGNICQNRLCEQTCVRSQNRNGLSLDAEEMSQMLAKNRYFH